MLEDSSIYTQNLNPGLSWVLNWCWVGTAQMECSKLSCVYKQIMAGQDTTTEKIPLLSKPTLDIVNGEEDENVDS